MKISQGGKRTQKNSGTKYKKIKGLTASNTSGLPFFLKKGQQQGGHDSWSNIHRKGAREKTQSRAEWKKKGQRKRIKLESIEAT